MEGRLSHIHYRQATANVLTDKPSNDATPVNISYVKYKFDLSSKQARTQWHPGREIK
jgi:hypothetical protein